MKRIGVYAFYDKEGIVDEYVYFYISELKKYVERVLFIVNGNIRITDKERLIALDIELHERENVGYDSFAYKYGLNKIHNLSEYDELILSNNSFFGPVYPLDDMFIQMSKENVDFWGVTVHPKKEGFIDESQPYTYINEHIQSFWIVFTKRVFTSQVFFDFWDKLQQPKTFLQAVCLFELRLTDYLSNHGFSYSSYVKSKSNDNETILYPYNTLVNEKCPFVKRKIFLEDYQNFISVSRGDQSHKTIDFLKSNFEKNNYYNPDLIWSHILRTEKLSVIRRNLQLSIIESSKYTSEENVEFAKKSNIATLMYVYYPESIDYCLSYLKNVEDYSDIYVVSAREDTLDLLRRKIGEIFNNESNYIEYRLKQNKGRDITSYLIDCKDLFDKYDFLIYFHDKVSPQLNSMYQTFDFSEHCMQSIMKTKEYVANLIFSFKQEPNLGMIVPPPLNFGPFYPSEYILHPNNEVLIKELIDRLDLNVPFDRYPVAPYGDFFISRTKSLKKLFNIDWTYSDIPGEPIPPDGTILHAIERIHPFVVQSSGYYVSWGFSEESVRIHDSNCYYYVQSLNEILMKKYKNYSIQGLINKINDSIEISRDDLVISDNGFERIDNGVKNILSVAFNYVIYKILKLLSFGSVKRIRHKLRLYSRYLAVISDSYIKSLNVINDSNLQASLVYGEILKDNIFEQEIYLSNKYISYICVKIATYNRINKSILIFTLYDSENNRQICSSIVDAKDIIDNSWVYFKVNSDDLIPNSKYIITLTSDATSGNGVTWWASNDNNGKATVNGKEVLGGFTWCVK